MSMKGCKHRWSDIFLTQYSQETEENTHRRADDAVDDPASTAHFIVFSKDIHLFQQQQDKIVSFTVG